MNVSPALRAGRAAALARMSDTVRITTPEGEADLDDDTLKETSTPGAVVYEGPCRVVSAEGQESTPNVADSDWTLTRYRLDVPVDDSAGIFTGCRAEMLSCQFDADLVGRKMRVLAPKWGSQTTVRRLTMQANV